MNIKYLVSMILVLASTLPVKAFEHHMLKEMLEQKETLDRTIDFCKKLSDSDALWLQLGVTSDTIKQVSSLHLVGAGTSWHAAHLGQLFFEDICSLPTGVSLASEYPYCPFFHEVNTLHCMLSQSGETADTLDALRFIKSFGQNTIAITNVAPSSMTREAGGFLSLQAGPEVAVASTKVFSNHVATLYWLAHKMALERGAMTPEAMHNAETDLLVAAQVLDATMKRYAPSISQELAPRFARYDRFIFLGRHVSYPLAMEAALKLKETSYICAQAYPAGEFLHGPLALVDNKTVVMLFSVLDEPIYQKLIRNAQAVKACQGQLIVCAFEGQDELIKIADVAFVIPRVKPLLGPLAMTGLMQLFVYHITCQLGLPVDKPRNLVKAVVGDAVPKSTKIIAKSPLAKRVLVCAPHPDDEIIGPGGSIAKHKKNGNEVSIVYMTSGDAGSLQYTKQELAEIREQEAKAGAQIIGAGATYFLRNPDGYLTYDQKNLIDLINLIREIKPDIVYIPHKNDAHKDHMVTYEIVSEAIKRASGNCFQECTGSPWTVETVLCYEVWTPLSEVTYTEDISACMAQKLEALRQHVSQVQDFKYDDAVEGLNRYRGTMTGIGKYGECFQVLKMGTIKSVS